MRRICGPSVSIRISPATLSGSMPSGNRRRFRSPLDAPTPLRSGRRAAGRNARRRWIAPDERPGALTLEAELGVGREADQHRAEVTGPHAVIEVLNVPLDQRHQVAHEDEGYLWASIHAPATIGGTHLTGLPEAGFAARPS